MMLEIKIARNASILFTATVISGLFFFISQIVIARYLGSSEFGVYSFTFAYAAISSYLIEGGLGTLMIREVSRHKNQAAQYLVGSIFNKACLLIVALIIAWVGLHYLQKDWAVTRLVFIFTVASFFEILANSFINIFKAYEEMLYPGIFQILKNFLIMVATLTAAYAGFSLIGMALLYSAACFFALLFIAVLFSLKHSIVTTLDIGFSLKMMKSSVSFCSYGLAFIFYTRIGTILVSLLQGDAAAGLYSASFKLVDMLSSVPGIFVSVSFPAMSIAHLESRETLRLVFKKVTQILIILILPICIGTSIIPGKIISYLYGSEYLPSSDALRVLIWAGLFIFMASPSVTLLNATNNQRKNFVIIAVVAVINVVLSMFLISRYSYTGASYAMVISEIFSFGLLYFSTHLYLKAGMVDLLMKPVIAGIAMGIVTFYIQGLNLAAVIFFSACVYSLSLVLLKTFSKEDIVTFKKIWKIRTSP